MTQPLTFTLEERILLRKLYRRLLPHCRMMAQQGDIRKIREILQEAISSGKLSRDVFGLNPIIRDIETTLIVIEEVSLRRSAAIAILLKEAVWAGTTTLEAVGNDFGKDIEVIIDGLLTIQRMQSRSSAVENENFHNFLLTLAKDVRVILIMIADRVDLMRNLRDTTEVQNREMVANEAAYLYAPLAHKLGLYKLKSELEDLFIKYTEHDVYYMIKDKLQETKRSRDAYIENFINPLKTKMEEAGLKCHIKGRTKSIHSIYQKMKKQKCAFEGVYDLFAIRIILDSPDNLEKQQCWQVYSIITDMYQPNPSRLRDWLSVPKSNGYESLHITVLGPQSKWVEVQIRTERMDDIAEHGLAAHWRYKGVQSGSGGMDEWLASIREALESNQDSLESMDHFKADLYKDEVFVFTPKGDVVKLPKGATVLDFAFHIHTKVGCSCIGARIGGRNVPIRHQLESGDQIEILTSQSQQPKEDWVSFVTTSKARTKIKQALKEREARQAQEGRDEIARKFKNRKLDYDDAVMMHLIKRLGYKSNTRFYQQIAIGQLEVSYVIDQYLEQVRRETTPSEEAISKSADNYYIQDETERSAHEDVLVIDRDLKGIQYQLARCCNPIYGDPIFGFVSVTGGIKIHRQNCPNATDMKQRFGYRIVKAKWSGKVTGTTYPITLMVVGQDDIGIVTNITSIIGKEEGTQLRSIGIDSHDGLFSGTLTITISDTSKLEALLKKIRMVKGVKNASRL